MRIILPEALQKEVENLATREGIDIETLVIRAVELFLRQQQDLSPRVSEARQRLRALNQHKLRTNIDPVIEIHQIRTKIAQLYLGEEALEQSELQVAEQRTEYKDDLKNTKTD